MVRQKPDGSKHLVRLADMEDSMLVPIRTDEEGIDRMVIYYPTSLDLPDKRIALFTWVPIFDGIWKQDSVTQIKRSWIEVIDRTGEPFRQILEEIGAGVDWCDGTHDLLIRCNKEEAIYWPRSQMRLIHDRYTYTSKTKYLCAHEIDPILVWSCTNDVQPDERKYYARLTPGDIREKLWIYTPEKVLSDIFSVHLKQFTAMTRRDRSNVIELLNNVDQPTILHDITTEFDCSLEEARRLYESYISHVEAMLSVNDWDGAIFQNLIDNSSNLSQKMLEAVELDWKEKNTDLVKQSTQLEQGIEAYRRELALLDGQVAQRQKTVDDLEHLEQNVKDKVNALLAGARSDISTLLSEYSWLSPTGSTVVGDQSDILLVPDKTVEDSMEETDQLESAQYNLKINLGEAGVLVDSLATELTQFLFGSYCSKTNLLIAGIGGADIATALSAALCGCDPAVLIPERTVSQRELHRAISTCPADIITVPNALSGDCFEKVITAAGLFPDKMFLFLTPFADSLAAEPQGTYQYMLPLIADIFVSDRANRNYIYANAKKIATDVSPSRKLIARQRAENQSICDTLALTQWQMTMVAIIRATLRLVFDDINLDQACFRTMYLPLAVCLAKTESLDGQMDRMPAEDEAKQLLTWYLDKERGNGIGFGSTALTNGQ